MVEFTALSRIRRETFCATLTITPLKGRWFAYCETGKGKHHPKWEFWIHLGPFSFLVWWDGPYTTREVEP